MNYAQIIPRNIPPVIPPEIPESRRLFLFRSFQEGVSFEPLIFFWALRDGLTTYSRRPGPKVDLRVASLGRGQNSPKNSPAVTPLLKPAAVAAPPYAGFPLRIPTTPVAKALIAAECKME
jgi:hypothetical protein